MLVLLVLADVESLLQTYRISKKVTGFLKGSEYLYQNFDMELGKIDLTLG